MTWNRSFVRIARGSLSWVLPPVGLVVTFCLVSCSDSPKVAPGCYMNGSVPGPVRRGVEAAADAFNGHLRSGNYDAAYLAAASAMKERTDKEQVTMAWTAIAEDLTLPAELATVELVLVAVAEGDRGPRELDCIDPADASAVRKMMATDQPLQAYLIQSGRVGGTVYSFASVWYYEEEAWRNAIFGTKPMTVTDHDWAWWANLAAEQKKLKNHRNAALLYNLAMDLLLPAPWVRPAALAQLMAEQRKLFPENLPKGRKERWVTLDDTEFFPFMSGCDIVAGGVGVRFVYEVPADADSMQVSSGAIKLADFVRTTFPEYGEVFQVLRLEAVRAGDRATVWVGEFPLR